MVVVPTLIQLKDRLTAFKVMAGEQPRLLELGQDTVHRRQTDIEPLIDQYLVYILGAQMAHTAMLEQVEYLQPWHCRLEAGGFQVIGGGHKDYPWNNEINAAQATIPNRKWTTFQRPVFFTLIYF